MSPAELSCNINGSGWNFTWSKTVRLSCTVQHFKIILQWIESSTPTAPYVHRWTGLNSSFSPVTHRRTAFNEKHIELNLVFGEIALKLIAFNVAPILCREEIKTAHKRVFVLTFDFKIDFWWICHTVTDLNMDAFALESKMRIFYLVSVMTFTIVYILPLVIYHVPFDTTLKSGHFQNGSGNTLPVRWWHRLVSSWWVLCQSVVYPATPGTWKKG